MKLTHTDAYGTVSVIEVADSVAPHLLANEAFAEYAKGDEKPPKPEALPAVEAPLQPVAPADERPIVIDPNEPTRQVLATET